MSEQKVNLNQATASELAGLPGIGEKMAAKIVDYRKKKKPFSDVAELAAVQGISETKASELTDYLFVEAGVAEASVAAEEIQKEEKKVEAKPTTKEKPTAKEKPSTKAKAPDSKQLLPELRTASRDGDLQKVEALLQAGADGSDKFALLWAAQNGHDQVVVELIKAGADVNSKSAEDGTHALALAAQNGHLAVVQVLVEAGADVNEPAIEGCNPLMKAALFGHEEIAKTLLLADAKIRSRDVYGQTAADYARKAGNQKILALLSR